MNTTDLSVAIIFKDEIRCLERCLKSLQPLRERVSVQIVMADTGSTDGSREIAARYADVLIDFPWINDFAAARNATLERCTGRWILVLDCDEWLDKDIDEFAEFLRSKQTEYNCGAFVMHNYTTAELSRYNKQIAMRLLSISAEPRYKGVIHEQVIYEKEAIRLKIFEHTILHHDGYVMLNDNSEAGKEKRKRNVELLRKRLAENPDEIRALSEFLDSGKDEPDYEDMARHAAALVRKKANGWEGYGPPLLRSAIEVAFMRNMPELEDWGEAAFKLFPNSYYTRIDVAMTMALHAAVQDDADKTIYYGEMFLNAQQSAADDKALLREITASTLHRNVVTNVNRMHNVLAKCYAIKRDKEQVIAHFRNRPWTELPDEHIGNTLVILRDMLHKGYLGGPQILDCWEGISQPIPSEERRDSRIKVFQDFCNACAEVGDNFPSPELLSVASKMRALLAKLPPDDPMAVELKSSASYQKIAWLLEK